MTKTINIVGSGLSGATACALLKGHYKIKVFETRSHIAGNCFDGLLSNVFIHHYGPHIFHTDDEEVFLFLSKYTEWRDFYLRPKGNTKIGLISLPYSKKTISEIGRELSEEEIVDLIFKDYSEKQWGVDFNKIPKSITNRIPKTKNCENPTWFEGQKYQCVPKYGYTKMIEKMLEGAEAYLNCDPDEWKKHSADIIIYTGKIDDFYEQKFGKLPYRSLDFKHFVSNQKQDHFIINENTKNFSYTRRYDQRFFDDKDKSYTVITEEYPKECKDGDIPYYPIPFGDGPEVYKKYEELAKNEKNIIFLGRLATYKYLDMWMAVKQAMLKLKNFGLLS